LWTILNRSSRNYFSFSMDNVDDIKQATAEHLEKISKILPGLPQFQISVNTSRQQLGGKTFATKSRKGKVKREVVCRFCYTPLPTDTSLEEHTCTLCNRTTVFEQNKIKKAMNKPEVEKKELVADNTSSKKKKRKVKEENAGLVIPRTLMPSFAHDLKIKNQKKEKLMALLAKPALKKESKLQDFLKLVQ